MSPQNPTSPTKAEPQAHALAFPTCDLAEWLVPCTLRGLEAINSHFPQGFPDGIAKGRLAIVTSPVVTGLERGSPCEARWAQALPEDSITAPRLRGMKQECVALRRSVTTACYHGNDVPAATTAGSALGDRNC